MKYYDTDMALKESDWDMTPMSKHLLNLLFGRIKEVDSEDILNLLMWFKNQLKAKYPDLKIEGEIQPDVNVKPTRKN